ncbi:MAG: NAD-dependent epimerase/dehydratase family protein, partial [Planctomycetes bacterium]|nr:NAD-dependent epimerase/dehydratase family protein [Planctomycetota bacterium]
MECVVTGAAGFIGSHLCERLLDDGHRVVGIDCFTNYYPRIVKESHLASLRGRKHFEFHELDLSSDPIDFVVRGAEWVFHLAAMAGLVKSWTHFDQYNTHNLTATQRLLEAVKESPNLNRLIYASTSSVYGRYASGDESLPLKPSSPYGITKLASENLCRVYADEFDVPAIVLRYFSVYGPRQRPDMGYHKFIQAVLEGQPIQLTGDGSQVRGNTYVTDCVAATVAAVNTVPGETFNVGGGDLVSVSEVIRKIEKMTGKVARIQRQPERKGDQKYTGADVTKLSRHTGWKPKVGFEEGLALQIAWQTQPALSRVA